MCADSTIKKLCISTEQVPQCPWQNWDKLLPTVCAVWAEFRGKGGIEDHAAVR